MSAIKKTLFIVFAAVLLVELLVRVMPINEKQKEVFSMESVASLSKESWFNELMAEQGELRRRFQEYEIYSLEPYQGKHIRISNDGYRETPNPLVTKDRNIRVGIFGGSTVWGGWAREAHTIPAEMSSTLATSLPGLKAEVLNYGQIGYVFSQEVHQAVRILSSTRPSETPVPKMMIFLDGVCDALASFTNFMQGTSEPSGKPWEFEKYAYLFQLGKTGEVSSMDIAKKSKAFRMGLKIAERYGVSEPEKKNIFVQPTPRDLEVLAKNAGRAYLATLKTAHLALSANGVTPVFILQPAFFAKEKKSSEEQVLEKQNAHWLPYVAQTYEYIQGHLNELPKGVKFYDWSRLFDGDESTLYADVMHYSEAGNAKIGQAMAVTFSNLIEKEATSAKGPASTL